MIKLKDLLKESKRLNLFEQAKTYKSHEMRGSFMANYVTPNAGWKEDFAPIIKDIQDLLKQGYKLDQINVVIKSGASPEQASNRYEGANPPKHNFERYIPTGTPTGGLLPAAGWIKVGEGTRVGIPDGNAFLAAERGRQLRSRIEPLLKSTFTEIPANFIIMDPKLNDEQFASYQVQTKGELEPAPKEINYRIGTIGGNQGEIALFTKNNPKGNPRGFNMRLLPKASSQKQRVSIDPNTTFQGEDFGRGPGVSVYISAAMVPEMIAQNVLDYRTMDSYWGDEADLEKAVWDSIQYLNSDDGKNNPRAMYAPSKYKKPLDLDLNPQTKKPWRYIDPKTGEIKPGIQPIENKFN